jgi:predicted transcriptional regulator
MDVASYEAMARRANILDALSAGEREVVEGKVHSWEEVKAELASWQR